MYKVYQYIFPDGKMYIGTTKNSIAIRRDQGYQHNKLLQNAMREVGWQNIKVVILADNLSQSEVFNAEKRFIAEYHSNYPNIGYNISNGGKATYQGLKHTVEYRQRMSDLYKGRSFSEQTLQRMKEAHAKERMPVICKTLDGEIIKRYESLNAAAIDIGGHPTNVARACRKINKTYKGFIWDFD